MFNYKNNNRISTFGIVCIYLLVTMTTIESSMWYPTYTDHLLLDDSPIENPPITVGLKNLHKPSVDKPPPPQSYPTVNQYCSNNWECTGYYEYCNTAYSKCECQTNNQYDYYLQICMPCPRDGLQCINCCNTPGYECIGEICTRCYSDDGRYLCDTPTVIFVTASQIALSAALIMGAIALGTLLYRICTKPSYFGQRRDGTLSTESAFQRISRASLTSIQVRVLSRLRDRPPKYETQHNYDSRLQLEQEQAQQTNTTETAAAAAASAAATTEQNTTLNSNSSSSSSSSPCTASNIEGRNNENMPVIIISEIVGDGNCGIVNIAPPAYDGTRDSISGDQPPPYTPSADSLSLQLSPISAEEFIIRSPTVSSVSQSADPPPIMISSPNSWQHLDESKEATITINLEAKNQITDSEKSIHM